MILALNSLFVPPPTLSPIVFRFLSYLLVTIYIYLQDLEDDTEYADIKTDVAEECAQYGKVK